jgi:hypothetical protein
MLRFSGLIDSGNLSKTRSNIETVLSKKMDGVPVCPSGIYVTYL